MLEKFMTNQQNFNDEQKKAIEDQKHVNQQFHAAIKDVEHSVSQMAKEKQREPGKLPTTTNPNTRV